jgi:hypothetical protein
MDLSMYFQFKYIKPNLWKFVSGLRAALHAFLRWKSAQPEIPRKGVYVGNGVASRR